jgi:hypothetical protein
VEVNGIGRREITALFSGDSIQTTEDSVANIVADGSSVLVMQNALVTFMGDAVELSAGGVSVATSKGMAVTAYGADLRAIGAQPLKVRSCRIRGLGDRRSAAG